jgi:hypothetical protein
MQVLEVEQASSALEERHAHHIELDNPGEDATPVKAPLQDLI